MPLMVSPLSKAVWYIKGVFIGMNKLLLQKSSFEKIKGAGERSGAECWCRSLGLIGREDREKTKKIA